MTWAQNTFFYCFPILIPTMGILMAGRFRQRGRSGLLGFIAGTFLGGMTFIGCCVVAKLCFPRYPLELISEWVANAFTLPILGTGLLFTWRFPRLAPERKKFGRRWSVALGALYLGCVGIGYYAILPTYRTALPWSASEIHDSSNWGALPSDGIYWLKARITRAEFDAYVAEFNLKRYTPSPPPSGSESGGGSIPGLPKFGLEPLWGWGGPRTHGTKDSGWDPWWDPSRELAETYYSRRGMAWTFAKYERGYLYLHRADPW
jgi:hypothetical protein